MVDPPFRSLQHQRTHRRPLLQRVEVAQHEIHRPRPAMPEAGDDRGQRVGPIRTGDQRGARGCRQRPVRTADVIGDELERDRVGFQDRDGFAERRVLEQVSRVRARLGNGGERLAQLLEPLRRCGRVSGSGVRLARPRSKNTAGAMPEQRDGNSDDEREDDFERHVRCAILGGATADEVGGLLRQTDRTVGWHSCAAKACYF